MKSYEYYDWFAILPVFGYTHIRRCSWITLLWFLKNIWRPAIIVVVIVSQSALEIFYSESR